ncbi:porin family protein [Acinetobacter junii]|uniref:hypothetical protein n=1 Tax=Acinetobacter junii TaxID=40215 RepID=UPI00190159ED|nr:hypothetical protein [Acinetobacter junii]MBJ8441431.1 hypothetical protein [Acinetobacter junii]
MVRLTLLILGCMGLSSQAYADTIKDSFQGETKVFLNIYGFAADINGTIGYQGINYQLDQPFKDTLEALDQALMGHLEVTKGKWGIYTDIQYVKTEEEKQVYNYPIALSTTVNLSNAGIYYRAFEQFSDGTGWIIEPTLGVNYTDLEGTLDALGKGVAVEKDWFEYFGGARIRYNSTSPWNLAAQYTHGTEQTQIAQAYLGYRKAVFSTPVNFRVGYRYVSQDYSDGNFKWDTVQKGPVVGLGFGF